MFFFIVVLQLGKEKFIDILKDQHPKFNQSASNGVLVSLNENKCSECTAFKIFISILFIGFNDMKSSPFVDEIHWTVEYLKLATKNATDVCTDKNPLSCLNLMLLEADLNLLVLQRGNLLMFNALLPLLLTVPRWMFHFPANGMNPRNLNLVASFPLVGDPAKACKVLWDTFQFLSRKSSAGMLACCYFLTPFASSSHVH